MTKKEMTPQQRNEVAREIYRLVRDFVSKTTYLESLYMEKEDLIQILVAHAYKVLDQYDKSKGSFSTWIWAVCRFKCLALYKHNCSLKIRNINEVIKLSLDTPIKQDDEKCKLIDLIPSDDNTHQYLETNIYDKFVKPYEGSLSENEIKALRLFYYKNLNYMQIDKYMHWGRSWARQYIQHAMKILRTKIKRYGVNY